MLLLAEDGGGKSRKINPSDESNGFWVWGDRSCGVPRYWLPHTFSPGEPYKKLFIPLFLFLSQFISSCAFHGIW
jgi:hypothetical protein